MNNLLAYQFFCERQCQGARSITDIFISTYGLDPDQYNHFRLKFTNLQKDRERFRKNSDLEAYSTAVGKLIPNSLKQFVRKLMNQLFNISRGLILLQQSIKS